MGLDDGEDVAIIFEDSSLDSSQPPSTIIDDGRFRNLRRRHLTAATGLILTYFTEIGVQVFLTIYCYRALLISSSQFDWAWILGISLGVSSIFVSIVSIVWVWKGLDFAGRLCGRFLCYFMHFFLLGLVWRYLKLACAYDPADVQEFVALRIFQVHIQSLPLISSHLAWLIITHRENWTNLMLYLVAIEAVSVTIALIIALYIKSYPEQKGAQVAPSSATTQRFLDNLMCSSKDQAENIIWCRVLSVELNILSRGLLLSARLLVVAILIDHTRVWAGPLILCHFIITMVWISVRETFPEIENAPKNAVKWSFETSCVLFWDATSTLTREIRLSTWAMPALLLLVENICLVLVHWYRAHGQLEVTITTGTCLIVGTLLFVFLNLLPRLGEVFSITGSQKESGSEIQTNYSDELEKGFYPCVLKGSESASIKGPPWDSTGRDITKSDSLKTYNNYTNMPEIAIKEGNMNRNYTENRRHRVERTSSRLLVRHPNPNWLPDVSCNDSNGSSNSRNTNTLHDESTSNVPGAGAELVGTHFVFCYPQQARGHFHGHSRPSRPDLLQPRRSSRSISKNSVNLRTSSPVEIKSASRVIMNPNPRHGHRIKKSSPRDPNKRLLEDSYGILICESDVSQPNPLESNIQAYPSISYVNKRLRVLCAKCFQNHDPLLTDCLVDNDSVEVTTVQPKLPSETTDYPSETEMTWTALEEYEPSLVSSGHSADTATRVEKQIPTQTYSTVTATMIPSSSEFPRQFTSREYVRTWLMNSPARIPHQFNQNHDLNRRTIETHKKLRSLHSNSDSYRKTAPFGSKNCNRRVNRVKVPTEELQTSVSEDEGCCVVPSLPLQTFEHVHSCNLAQNVIPYEMKTYPVIARAFTHRTIYENGLTEETLQMFYKDLEIIVLIGSFVNH